MTDTTTDTTQPTTATRPEDAGTPDALASAPDALHPGPSLAVEDISGLAKTDPPTDIRATDSDIGVGADLSDKINDALVHLDDSLSLADAAIDRINNQLVDEGAELTSLPDVLTIAAAIAAKLRLDGGVQATHIVPRGLKDGAMRYALVDDAQTGEDAVLDRKSVV